MGLLGKRSRRAPARPRKKSRKMVLYRKPRNASQPMLNVTRTFWTTTWTPTTTSTTDFWRFFNFNLGQVPNISEYTNLFDSYRLNSIMITLRPRYDNFAGNDTTDTTLPGVTNQASQNVHVIIDPKSSITPSGTYTSGVLNSFLENGKVRTYQGTKVIKINIKYPCYADDVNGSAASKFVRSQYMSTSNTLVNFRGAHVFIQDVNLTGVFGNQYDVFYTYNVTFKGMR